MPHLTAAQNIFIGREPRMFGGLLLDETRLNDQRGRRSSRRCISSSTPDARCRG